MGPSFLGDNALKTALETEKLLKVAVESDQLLKMALEPERLQKVAGGWGLPHLETA